MTPLDPNHGIVAADLSASYGSVVALRGVDLVVPGGRVCGVVGVNGAGKSTLFKALLGLVPLDSGTVDICGLTALGARRKRLVAYVPQADATDPTFPIRVRDVVSTGRFGHLRPPRRLRQEDRDAVTAALERVEMLEHADRQVGALSGGQRRRVFVARALAQDARVLLLDEPFTGIDVATQELVIACLREVAAEGRSILVSTHDLTSLSAMCDDLLLLNRTAIAFGAVDDVLTEANLMKTFRMAWDSQTQQPLPAMGQLELMGSLVETLVEPMQYGFMQRALLASLMIGATCAVLSCFITLRGWALMGDAVSHSVVPGVALSFILGLPFALGAFVFGFLSVFFIGFIRSNSRIKEDASMGIVFTGLFALGLVMISLVPSQVDLLHILFGNVLGVSVAELFQIAVISVVVLVAVLFLRRDLLAWIFDPVHAASIGLRTNMLRYLLLALLALTVTTALQAVGVVLVVAMVITPGATAYLLTDRFDLMLIIAVVTSTLSCAAGTYMSFYLDATTGPLIVTTQTALFLLVFVLAPRYGLLAGRLGRRRAVAQRT